MARKKMSQRMLDLRNVALSFRSLSSQINTRRARRNIRRDRLISAGYGVLVHVRAKMRQKYSYLRLDRKKIRQRLGVSI